jgi:hypothetical protein
MIPNPMMDPERRAMDMVSEKEIHDNAVCILKFLNLLDNTPSSSFPLIE